MSGSASAGIAFGSPGGGSLPMGRHLHAGALSRPSAAAPSCAPIKKAKGGACAPPHDRLSNGAGYFERRRIAPRPNRLALNKASVAGSGTAANCA